MAGVKGKSGGARVGAGRKPKPKVEPTAMGDRDMLQVLQDVALGRTNATTLQVRAAIAAVQYTHVKKGEGGKKDAASAAGAKAAAGKFGTRAPPQLVVSNK